VATHLTAFAAVVKWSFSTVMAPAPATQHCVAVMCSAAQYRWQPPLLELLSHTIHSVCMTAMCRRGPGRHG
jgi:hypothetical protein